MDPAVQSYIDISLGKDLFYSEVLVAGSNGSGIVKQDLNKSGAVGFLIYSINVSVIAGAGAFTISDPMGRMLLQLDNQTASTGQYNFPPYIYAGGLLLLTSTVVTMNFSVTYQYARVKDKSKL